jgi:hypothetical protein
MSTIPQLWYAEVLGMDTIPARKIRHTIVIGPKEMPQDDLVKMLGWKQHHRKRLDIYLVIKDVNAICAQKTRHGV